MFISGGAEISRKEVNVLKRNQDTATLSLHHGVDVSRPQSGKEAHIRRELS
jgi:hypothetical protein